VVLGFIGFALHKNDAEPTEDHLTRDTSSETIQAALEAELKARGNDRTETRGTTLDCSGGEPTPGNARCGNDSPGNRSQAEAHGPSYLCPNAAAL
jgi:hypothetical protein